MQEKANEHRTRVADFWDSVLKNRQADPLMWGFAGGSASVRKSYEGECDLGAYPEGFVGDLRGEKREPRLVVLGLNPGVAYAELMGLNGKMDPLDQRAIVQP